MRSLKNYNINIPPQKIDIDINEIATIGDCVKELIKASFEIYNKLLNENILNERESTIICGGQSPSYYCLAMMHFQIYNPYIVNIVILPHSKHGIKTEIKNTKEENNNYCKRLKEKKDLVIKDNIIIIDGVHTGTGILALENALIHCYDHIKSVKKIAINAHMNIAEIKVDEEKILLCEPIFSDKFPRLVEAYYPKDFYNSDKFITDFINLDDNIIAHMIIQIAKYYHEIQVEDTDWYRLNHNPTDKTIENYENHKEELQIQKRKIEEGYFKPIVLTNPRRYQCPICKSISGTAAPNDPTNLSFFTHIYNCLNRFKTPQE